MRNYYCFFEDSERRRSPAFDSDIELFAGEEGLARLREPAGQCAAGHPELSCVIVDDDSGEVVDVFGGLVREQQESIEWDEVKEQERRNAFPEEEGQMPYPEDPPVPF